METTRRAHVFVRGKVQGVYFRQSCAAEARAREVRGFVRNLHDGRVEAVFEGAAGAVAEMIEWCRRGPPAAKVEDIELHESDPAGEKSFEVQP